MSEDLDYSLLDEILFSTGAERIGQLPPESRFAHYTSTDAAVAMIRETPEKRSIWLRCATEMNDFSEVEYGQHCLGLALSKQEIREQLDSALNAVDDSILPQLTSMLTTDLRVLKRDTYLLSLAQHEGSELESGLLSMWRAYGGPNNVCLIFKPAPFITDQDAYDAYIAPVYYGGSEGFEAELLRIASE